MNLAPHPYTLLIPLYWGSGWFGLLLGAPVFAIGEVTQATWWNVAGALLSGGGWVYAIARSRKIYATDREIVWRGGLFGLRERRTALQEVEKVVLEEYSAASIIGSLPILTNVAPGVHDLVLVTRAGVVHLHQVADAARCRDELLRRRERLYGPREGVA